MGMEPSAAQPVVAQAHSLLFIVLGWIPALIFPAATGLQLFAIIHKRCSQGVSVIAWTLFALANICLFVYTEKYGEIESIVGTLGTAFLNLCIVVAAIRYRKTAVGNPNSAARVEAPAGGCTGE